MKTVKILTLIFALAAFGTVLAVDLGTYHFDAPVVVASGATTNLMGSAAIDLEDKIDGGQPLVRMGFSFKGGAGSTNGNVVVTWSSSFDGIIFDDPSSSNIQLTVPGNGAQITQGSGQFNLTGIKAIKLTRIQDATGAAITNFLSTLNTAN